MVEKDFTADLIQGLIAQGAYAEKWPDGARGVKKPFDICAAFAGHFYPIECKLRKFETEERLPTKTVVLSPADFKGRKHQLPNLLKMQDQNQAKPFVAAFVLVEREFRQPLKFGWLIPVERLRTKDTWTLMEVIDKQNQLGLTWVPNIGWTVPWLPSADANRLKETPCSSQP